MNLCARFFICLLIIIVLALCTFSASRLNAQDSAINSDGSGATAHPIVPEKPAYAYQPPTETMKLNNYLFDAYGPYPLTITAFVAAYHQAKRNPPDWREGWPGYGMRYGSDFGTSVAGVTARYLAAEALHEDTMYYRCACNGIWPRLQHAVVSTFIARRGEDGHKAPDIPGILQPYAGSFTAVFGWYPRRYGAKDAFRMGNYGMMESTLGNVGLEFLPSISRGKGRSLIFRLHLDNRHAARAGESAP